MLLIEKYSDILNDYNNDIMLNKYSNYAELKLWHNSFEHKPKQRKKNNKKSIFPM